MQRNTGTNSERVFPDRLVSTWSKRSLHTDVRCQPRTTVVDLEVQDVCLCLTRFLSLFSKDFAGSVLPKPVWFSKTDKAVACLPRSGGVKVHHCLAPTAGFQPFILTFIQKNRRVFGSNSQDVQYFSHLTSCRTGSFLYLVPPAGL